MNCWLLQEFNNLNLTNLNLTMLNLTNLTKIFLSLCPVFCTNFSNVFGGNRTDIKNLDLIHSK